MLALLLSVAAYAQPQIEFDKTKHDFGEIPEGPKASYTFEFTNTGDAPLTLQNVRASCGCTTPEWSREPIMPGEKGKITAVYNTKGRPGVFRKTITISSNAEEPTMRLYINGNVIREAQEEEQNQNEGQGSINPNVKMPKLKIDNRVHNFGKMEVNQALAQNFRITNEGEKPISFRSVYSRCNCTSYRVVPEILAPGATGTLTVTYRPKSLGKQEEEVYVVINAPFSEDNIIKLNSEVVKSLEEKSVVREQSSFFGE